MRINSSKIAFSSELDLQNRRLQRELKLKESTIDELRERVDNLEKKLEACGGGGGKNCIDSILENHEIFSCNIFKIGKLEFMKFYVCTAMAFWNFGKQKQFEPLLHGGL